MVRYCSSACRRGSAFSVSVGAFLPKGYMNLCQNALGLRLISIWYIYASDKDLECVQDTRAYTIYYDPIYDERATIFKKGAPQPTRKCEKGAFESVLRVCSERT